MSLVCECVCVGVREGKGVHMVCVCREGGGADEAELRWCTHVHFQTGPLLGAFHPIIPLHRQALLA